MSNKPLNELSVKEAQTMLADGTVSSVELTRSCLETIEAKDPEIHAFVTVLADDAMDAAKRADQVRKTAKTVPPLLGIPFAVKDNFLTKGARTTASSKVLDNYYPQYSATVIEKLEASGGVILGKTNMDAWAHGSSTETSDYGPTHNPWDTKRLAGGSSGGSAAALAAAETIAAVGTETAGSIRQPSSWCGTIGFKPTYGRVSRYGVVAMGSSLDSPGPMTKSVEDAALILGVIAGHDARDATTAPVPVPNYLGDLQNDIHNLKIGLPKEYFMTDSQPGVNEMVKKAAAVYENLGAQLVEVSLLDPKYSIADYTIVQRSEVSSNLARYTGVRYGNDRSYFGDEAKRRIMLGTYALSSGYYDAYYKKAQAVRMLMKRDFDRVFEQVDLILSPTTPSTALPLGATHGQAMFGELADVLAEASSLTGHPAINMPVGLLQGLPVGMQLIGNHFAEQKILNAAYAYEQATNWRENTL